MRSHRTTLTQQFPALCTQAMTRHTSTRGARARIHYNLYCGPPVQPCRSNPTCDRHSCSQNFPPFYTGAVFSILKFLDATSRLSLSHSGCTHALESKRIVTFRWLDAIFGIHSTDISQVSITGFGQNRTQ